MAKSPKAARPANMKPGWRTSWRPACPPSSAIPKRWSSGRQPPKPAPSGPPATNTSPRAAPWTAYKTSVDQAAVGVRTGLNLVALFGVIAPADHPGAAKKILDALGVPEDRRSLDLAKLNAAGILDALPDNMPISVPPQLFTKIEDAQVAEIDGAVRRRLIGTSQRLLHGTEQLVARSLAPNSRAASVKGDIVRLNQSLRFSISAIGVSPVGSSRVQAGRSGSVHADPVTRPLPQTSFGARSAWLLPALQR